MIRRKQVEGWPSLPDQTERGSLARTACYPPSAEAPNRDCFCALDDQMSQDAFLWRAAERPAFWADRWCPAPGEDDLRRSLPPFSALTLCRSASIKSTTLDGLLSLGRSIFSPFCFFLRRSFKASS